MSQGYYRLRTRRLAPEEIPQMCAWCEENGVVLRYPGEDHPHLLCLDDLSKNYNLWASEAINGEKFKHEWIIEDFRYHLHWHFYTALEDKAAMFQLCWG